MFWPNYAVQALFSFLKATGPVADEVASAVAVTSTAIGGIYTLSGMAIADLFGHSSKKDREIVGAQLEKMIKKLNENNGLLKEINGTTLQNNEMLKGLQIMLHKTAEENRQTLSHIQDTLKWFEDSMNRNFDELQAFIVEKDFTNDVLIPLRLQSDYMKKAKELKTKDSFDQFLLSYKSNPPRQILAKFIIGLNFSYANPIKQAMEAKPLESRTILDCYRTVVADVIFRVESIEAFHFGLSDSPKNGTTEHLNIVSKESLHALNAFRSYFAGYTSVPKEKYWPNLVNRTVMESTDGSDINNIADKLYEILNGIHTTDVFSIYVIKCRDWTHDWTQLDCYALPIQTVPFSVMLTSSLEKMIAKISSHMVRGLNEDQKTIVTVLRSEKFNEFDSQKRDLARASYRSFALSWSHEYAGSIPTLDHGTAITRAIALRETLTDLFQANIVNGFMSFNATVAVRVTSNAHPILTEDDTSLIPAYFGLTWI